MSLREKLNGSNSRVAVGIGAGLLVIAIALIFFQTRGGTPVTRAEGAAAQVYYTTDDGASWFADRPDRVPPFDHDGKPAVRAMVYRGTDGKPFVGYLIKYSDQAIKEINSKAKDISLLRTTGMEVKKPKDPTWVPQNSMAGAKISSVTLPGGGVADVVNP